MESETVDFKAQFVGHRRKQSFVNRTFDRSLITAGRQLIAFIFFHPHTGQLSGVVGRAETHVIGIT